MTLMANLQDLINLAKADGGKFFIVDESGEARLVIMPFEEYQRISLKKLKQTVLDVEKVNREIISAQLSESQSEKPVSVDSEIRKFAPKRQDLRSEVIDPSFDFEAPKIDLDEI
jgi:hypothetical protein